MLRPTGLKASIAEMSNFVSLEILRSMVTDEGKSIRWAGATAAGRFQVVVTSEGFRATRYICNPMSWSVPEPAKVTLRFKEADDQSPRTISYSPPDTTVFSQSRRASVFDVNIGGDCTPGACKKYTPLNLYAMTYDIKTRMDKRREGGFTLNDSDILSIAGKCSCGEEFYTCTRAGRSSTQMVSDLLLYTLEHAPLWTIG